MLRNVSHPRVLPRHNSNGSRITLQLLRVLSRSVSPAQLIFASRVHGGGSGAAAGAAAADGIKQDVGDDNDVVFVATAAAAPPLAAVGAFLLIRGNL